MDGIVPVMNLNVVVLKIKMSPVAATTQVVGVLIWFAVQTPGKVTDGL
jgi:hypothetical protein